MLRGIAVFSMQGCWQTAIAIVLFSVGALMLPPLSYLASGVIALCTLRMGQKEGIKAVIVSTVIFTLLAGLLLNNVVIAGVFLISSWLPMLGISLVLGYTRSLAVSFLVAGGLGILFVLGSYLAFEPAIWWQQILGPFMENLGKQPNWQLDQAQMQALMLSLSKMMTGLVAAGLSMNLMLGLLIGRAWQAKLYNPGGFASEFQQLRLGKSAAMLMIALMVVSALPTLGDTLAILRECLPVALVVFALQGLSVVHSIVRQRQKQPFWLVAMYVLLVVILPQMVVILAMIGVLEQWFNFRRLSAESGE